MNHAFGMRGVESPADLLHDTHSFDRGKFSPFPQQRFQIAALDIFHGEKLHPIGLAKVVDPDHVLVRNLPRQDQFLLEALENRWGVREFRTNDFQSDQAIEFAVLGLVNRSHATFAQQMKDLVSPAQHSPRLEPRNGGLMGQRLVARGTAPSGRCGNAARSSRIFHGWK